MERIIDKIVLLACCIAGMLILSFSTTMIVALLLGITISTLHEVGFIPSKLRSAAILVYLVIMLFVPDYVWLLPLISYDCFTMRSYALKICWLVPLLVVAPTLTPLMFLFILVGVFISGALWWRTDRILSERTEFMHMRDELRELSLALENKNQDLQEKQDYEVKLATLSERSRIAREIHDNVGHLLTRSVLQIEALQVVHADDEQVKAELLQVGDTVHKALETVRESVHDLHDDAFDLYTQLFAIQKQSTALTIDLTYECEEVPSAVGYCFVAIVREALSNSMKHSDATKATISVVEHPVFWQLIVQDNGTVNPSKNAGGPFTSARVSLRSDDLGGLTNESVGIGLKTMEDRTRTLNGIFRIDYDRGLRIFVSIPKTPDR